MLTQEKLKELFNYNPEEGVFTRKKRTSNRIKVGDKAGYLHPGGYIKIRTDNGNKISFAHRLAWIYHYGVNPDSEIDHINGIRTDNRISNLRLATDKQNAENRHSAPSNNKTGLLGVSPIGNRFMANISNNHKQIYLGCYKTPEEAHHAYLSAKRQLHGFCTI